MKIEMENVKGMYAEQGIKCTECMNSEDWENVTQDQIITTEDIEKEEGSAFYFCDYCEKQPQL